MRENMNKTKRFFLLLLLCTFLAACRIDANSILESEETLTIFIYSHGTLTTEKKIKKRDDSYNRLKTWMKENEKGWETSLVTFAPNVLVRGKKFNINFQPHSAIINFQSPDGQYHQYVKDIKETEFQYLLQK